MACFLFPSYYISDEGMDSWGGEELRRRDNSLGLRDQGLVPYTGSQSERTDTEPMRYGQQHIGDWHAAVRFGASYAQTKRGAPQRSEEQGGSLAQPNGNSALHQTLDQKSQTFASLGSEQSWFQFHRQSARVAPIQLPPGTVQHRCPPLPEAHRYDFPLSPFRSNSKPVILNDVFHDLIWNVLAAWTLWGKTAVKKA